MALAELRSHIKGMRTLAVLVPLLVLLGLSAWWATYVWTSIEGPPMPAGGYVAMWLGIVFSLAIGCGLMALIFYSHRYGYDEPAQEEKRPGQERQGG